MPIGFADPLDRAAQGQKDRHSSAGSLTDWLTKELERTQGWGPQGVTGVAIGNGASSIIAAFRENLIDADVAVTSLFLAMEENKTGRLLFPVSKYEGSLASGDALCVKHLIKTNPDAVRAFIAAWIETVDYIRTHKAETVKIESGITGFPESVMAKEYDLTIGMFTKACEFDAESLGDAQAFVRRSEAPATVRRTCRSSTPRSFCRSDGGGNRAKPPHPSPSAPPRSRPGPPDRRWWPASSRARRRRSS